MSGCRTITRYGSKTPYRANVLPWLGMEEVDPWRSYNKQTEGSVIERQQGRCGHSRGHQTGQEGLGAETPVGRCIELLTLWSSGELSFVAWRFLQIVDQYVDADQKHPEWRGK